MRASSLAAILLLAAARASAASVDLFPRPNEIFPLLIADPRHIQLSASYYRRAGEDDSDIALGHAWGLTRWRTGENQDWLWESDLEGMAYSRVRTGGGTNELQTVDFLAALPVTTRRGDASFKGELFHQSSHLGDDYIRRTGFTGAKTSSDGLRARAALDLASFARVYGGAEFLLRSVPAPERWSLQSGFELSTGDLRASKDHPVSLYFAEDLQWRERVVWNTDSHTVAGVRIGFKNSPSRAARVQVGYFTGHSPFGQFYSRRERYADLTVSFEL